MDGFDVSEGFGLVLQEIAAIDRVVKVLPLVIAQLPSLIVTGVDAALRAHAVRPLDRRETDQVDLNTYFGEFHGAG